MKYLQWLSKWPTVDRTRKEPRPLPGAYPTRWIVKGEKLNIRGLKVTTKSIFRYFGKPNQGLVEYFYRFLEHRPCNVRVTEIDRGGVIWDTNVTNSLRVHDWNESLAHYYYPWD